MTYAAPQPNAPYPTDSADVPLSQPLYGASFGQAFGRFWKKYATFAGRASRSEFWWWYLASILVMTVIVGFMIAGALVGSSYDPVTESSRPGPLLAVGGIMLLAWELAVLVPTIALAWRRLHDANLAGPFWFLGLIPGFGGIIVLVLMLLPSNPAGARFDR